MRYKHLLLLLLTILLMAAATVPAADLRGRIDGLNPYAQTIGPIPGVGIALFATLPNGSFELVRKTVTDTNGMYYFTGVPPGNYIVQAAGRNYPLAVGKEPTKDIPIIRK